MKCSLELAVNGAKLTMFPEFKSVLTPIYTTWLFLQIFLLIIMISIPNIFIEMKLVLPFLVVAILVSYQIGNVSASLSEYNLLDEYEKLDYVIDMVNEIELKLKLIQDMTMRLNILEVFVYQSQSPVNTGLDEVDNWSQNKAYESSLVDLSQFD